MWLIKYESDTQEGEEPHQILRWLNPSEVHTIGRDHNATFVMKNSKVSKQHLSIKVIQSDDPSKFSKLEVTILGKQTTIVNEVINKRLLSSEEQSVPIIRTLNSSTNIIVGKSGKPIELIRHSIIFNIANCGDLDLNNLRDLDINYSVQFLKYTTHMICSDIRVSTTTLLGLLKEIPIVTASFIESIDPYAISQDFEANFPDVDNYLPDSNAKIRHGRGSLFENILFVLGDASQSSRLSPSFEAGKGELLTLQISSSTTTEDLIGVINSSLGDKELVLVSMVLQDSDLLKSVQDPNTEQYHKSKMMSKIAKILHKNQVSMEDIFNAVKDFNIDSILKPKLSRPESPGALDGQPPVKKQKTTRKKKPAIKPLDSLDFFAGGGKFESSQVQPTTQVQETPESNYQEELEEGPPKKKKQRSRIQSLANQMLDTQFKPSVSSIPESRKDGISQQHIPAEETSVESQPEVQVEESKEANDENKENTQPPAPAPKSEKQTSFHNAVINAKKSANERINTQLGLNEVVTPDTINQLQNLAIVEVVNLPLREPSQTQSLQSTNPQWSGRKNFKTFVKNTKKTTSRAQKNQSFLYTREFVPLQTFDPRNPRDHVDDFAKDVEERHAKEQQQFGSQDDEQDGDEMNQGQSFAFKNDLRQQTMIDGYQPASKSGLFVQDSEDEDDVDDGLGMSVRKDQVEDIPEFRRQVTKEPLEVVKQKKAIEKQVPIPVDEEDYDDDDNDDDDDDTPKFRFRS